MADNTTLNTGTGGDVIATDDVSGVKYQRVKVTFGADGAAADVESTTTNPLPVALSDTDSTNLAAAATSLAGTLTVGTHSVTESGAALTALQLIDDAIYADDGAWTGDSSKHVLVGGIYQSALQTVTDGKTAPIQVDVNGRLVPAPSAAQFLDDADWSPASSYGVAIMGVHDAADTTRTPTSGDVAAFSLDPNANTRVVLPSTRKLTSSFARPADTTAYTANDAVATSTTASSVTPLSFSIPKSVATIRRVRIERNATAKDPQWRLWLFDTTLTPGAGDNAAFTAPLTDCVGFVDVDGSNDGSDVEIGWANCDIPVAASTVYGLLQTTSTWTPTSGETITVDMFCYPG